jgi:pyruvate dehydrogenase E1 component alpha subunit/2-oxoisovalerate dehydrogenase E1 component alpha subunit
MAAVSPQPRVEVPRSTPDALPPDVGLFRVLREDGSAHPVDPAIGPDIALRAYREMKRLRLIDARMILLQRQGRVGFYGACTGQEATPIGSALALEPDDWVFQALRESSIMLVRGLPLTTYLAQVFGNSADLLKGRQQPSHMAARQVKQVSWSSCIGTQLPQAVGAAMAAKQRGDSTAVVTFIGDGGTSEPDFHHAMNFAAVFRAPCVIICQNNHFAISVRSQQQTASATFAIKGRAYGVPSLRVDGNDALAMYHAVARGLARARRGDGPSFIEAVTYRIAAHSTSDDPSRYRSEEEVEQWLKRDPLQALRRHLVRDGRLDDARDKELETELNAEIAAAIREVEQHPPPERLTLFDDVYAELPWHLVEQRDELAAHAPVAAHGANAPQNHGSKT